MITERRQRLTDTGSLAADADRPSNTQQGRLRRTTAAATDSMRQHSCLQGAPGVCFTGRDDARPTAAAAASASHWHVDAAVLFSFKRFRIFLLRVFGLLVYVPYKSGSFPAKIMFHIIP